jgi:atypical dual specificity phosphatase
MPKRKGKQPKANSSDDKKESAVLVYPPYLYIGPRTAATSSFITSNSITHVLSIGSTPVSIEPSVTYHRISLSDDPSSSIENVSDEADTVIDAAKSGKILVHCSAAVSRSPTIVTAYLMKRCDMSLKDALGAVIRARPAVCPNAGFLEQLKEMELKLRGECSLSMDSLPAKKSDRLAIFQV